MKYAMCLFSLFLLACGSEERHEYSSATITEFMQGCTRGGVSASFCRCVLTELQGEYSETELIGVSYNIGTGAPVPNEVIDIANYCADQE